MKNNKKSKLKCEMYRSVIFLLNLLLYMKYLFSRCSSEKIDNQMLWLKLSAKNLFFTFFSHTSCVRHNPSIPEANSFYYLLIKQLCTFSFWFVQMCFLIAQKNFHTPEDVRFLPLLKLLQENIVLLNIKKNHITQKKKFT